MLGYGYDINDIVEAVCAAGIIFFLGAIPFVFIFGA